MDMMDFERIIKCDIIDTCHKYNIFNYKINKDFSITVRGTVNLSNTPITRLPLRFHRVTGDFICYRCQLTTLEGAPKYVGGEFDCRDNQLTSLEHSPIEVKEGFYCEHNPITSLEHLPKGIIRMSVGGNNLPRSFTYAYHMLRGSSDPDDSSDNFRTFLKYFHQSDIWVNGVYSEENMEALCDEIHDGLR